MNSVRSNNLSLKYQKFTPSVYKIIGTRKFEFVPKTQFLSGWVWWFQELTGVWENRVQELDWIGLDSVSSYLKKLSKISKVEFIKQKCTKYFNKNV